MLDQSFVYAFQQFSANGLSPLAAADEVASLDNNTQQYLVAKNPIDPSLLASFRAAAATVFGFNTQTLSHARGNTTQIGILLLGSAALSTGSLAAAAQSLSGSVVAAALSEDALQQAYPQAISQALQAATSERSYLIAQMQQQSWQQPLFLPNKLQPSHRALHKRQEWV
ncbi:hypothetical protein WJX82_008256 [Trebouxia sp. C0006]